MEKIDILKLLIFLLLFIIVTLFMILVVIVPNIKEYRASKKIYKTAYLHKVRVQNMLNDRKKELKNLRSQNRKIITSFSNKFSTKNFLDYTGTYFTKVALKEVGKKGHKNEFIEYKLRVTSSLKTPTNFYDFLTGLNRYDNIIQADFPITMEANGTKINSDFTIKVYDINSSAIASLNR